MEAAKEERKIKKEEAEKKTKRGLIDLTEGNCHYDHSTGE
jgi:hypothetical protein